MCVVRNDGSDYPAEGGKKEGWVLTSFLVPTSHFLYKGEQIYNFLVTMSRFQLMNNAHFKTVRGTDFDSNSTFLIAYPIDVYF